MTRQAETGSRRKAPFHIWRHPLDGGEREEIPIRWNGRGPSSASSPDIVLLDANPLEDIKNTESIWRVIKGGVVFDPQVLSPFR